MDIVRLNDLPAVREFEDRTLLNTELRSIIGAVNSQEFERLTKKLFGITFAEFGPQLPPSYYLDEEGYYCYRFDHDETADDLAAWAKFEEDMEIFSEFYTGLTARSDISLLEFLRQYGWEAADGEGRALYCMVPIAPMLLASARGDFSVPKLGPTSVKAEDWGVALAGEAARFHSSRR